MKMLTRSAIALLLAAAAATSAHAGQPFNGASVDVTITADNHYGLFTGDSTGLVFIGNNETGPGGSPGTYNWSRPESFSFTAGSYVYIAAWSDDNVAQGLLAQMTVNGSPLHSGDARWEVYPTFKNRGDNDPVPTTGFMLPEIQKADAQNLWQVPFVGPGNLSSTTPWGQVPGITSAAKWMWINTPGDTDPLNGGSGYGEVLIFRTAVPTPGAMALFGVGGLLAMRRKR